MPVVGFLNGASAGTFAGRPRQLRGNPQAAPRARVDGLEPTKCSAPAAERQAIFLGATELRDIRPERCHCCLSSRPAGDPSCQRLTPLAALHFNHIAAGCCSP